MGLESLGYRPEVDASFRALGQSSLLPARVVRAERHRAWVACDGSEERMLIVPPRLLASSSPPLAGDWVAFEPRAGVVTHVLPRLSAFERRRVGKAEATQVVAANVDLLVIVMSLDDDFSLRRLSRYLSLAHAKNIEARVLLTKAGLSDRVDELVEATRGHARAVLVDAVDVLAGMGLEAIASLVSPGRTIAFVGSSGVGKSTLVNHLLGREIVPVRAVRASDGTGMHTTTRRELHRVPGGGLVLDTPGMREVALVGDERGIDATFDDVRAFAERCRFRDCRHRGEPGCAVATAITRGDLDSERVAEAASFHDELSRTQRRALEKARGRRISSAIREMKRHERKRDE